MRNLSLAIAAFMSVAPTASMSQQLTGEKLCETVAPIMIEFATAISAIPDQFEKTYAMLSPADQTKFAAAKERGIALGNLSKDYRSEFLKACFSG